MDDLVKHLTETSRSLDDPRLKGIKPLRTLKDDVLRLYLDRSFSAETRACSFLLLTFLDDLFYNLAGDFPQEEPYGPSVANIRQAFFRSIGSTLLELAQAMARRDFAGVFNHYTVLVEGYLDSIEMINSKIKESQAS